MRDYFEQLNAILFKHEFEEIINPKENNEYIKWFASKSQVSNIVRTCLKFEYKRNFQTITVHIGWHHQQSYDFCINALKVNWSEGYSWFSQVGLVDQPCLLTHNLADFLDYPLGGIDVVGKALNSSHVNAFVHKVLDQNDWMTADANSLLARYVLDDKPFSWRSANSALRIGLIAGLLKSLAVDAEVFDMYANTHIKLIQSDMFQMGDASSWIESLRLS